MCICLCGCTGPQWRNVQSPLHSRPCTCTMTLKDNDATRRYDIPAARMNCASTVRQDEERITGLGRTASPAKVDECTLLLSWVVSLIPLAPSWDRPSAGMGPHQPEPRTRLQSFAMRIARSLLQNTCTAAHRWRWKYKTSPRRPSSSTPVCVMMTRTSYRLAKNFQEYSRAIYFAGER